MNFLTNLFSGESVSRGSKKRVVGIDIGSSSIKVVELEERDEVLTLTTYGELQLGPYAEQEIGQSVMLEPGDEQQALVDIIRESAVKAGDAVFAMPLASSFVTTINFFIDPKEDVSPRVRVEARKYIPVPIGEVTLDWAEIEGLNHKEENRRDVLIAAIQNDALARFRTLMQFASLKEPPTEIECFSAIRGVYSEAEKDIALIDVGAISTKLYIARNGLLQRMHRVRAGGALATRRISSLLQNSFEEAELLKRSITQGDQKFADVKRAHNSSYERTWQEFGQVIKEYEQNLDTEIEAVYLTGGASLFPGFKTMVEDTLQRGVFTVNTFNKLAYPAFMEDTLKELGPTFHVAIGAAMRYYE